MNKGDRVKTPHGNGTINGFEYYGIRTMQIKDTYDQYQCTRVEIKLDVNNTWSMYPGNPLYYCNPSELELL